MRQLPWTVSTNPDVMLHSTGDGMQGFLEKGRTQKEQKMWGIFFIIILISCFLLCFFKLDLRNNNDIVVLS